MEKDVGECEGGSVRLPLPTIGFSMERECVHTLCSISKANLIRLGCVSLPDILQGESRM